LCGSDAKKRFSPFFISTMTCLQVLFVYTLLLVLFVSSHPDRSTSIRAMKTARWNDDHYETRCNEELSQKARNSRRLAAMPTLKQSQSRAHRHSAAWKHRRDLDQILDSQHGFIGDPDEEVVIFSDPASYRLQSEMTSGPYYVDGELVRSNITGGQEGIPLILDIQFISTNTCQPIEGMYIDIWHCNATGVYSGVKSIDNGNFGNEDNLNSNFLRGIQPTDVDGAVQFSTVFPGHYAGMSHELNSDNGWDMFLTWYVSYR
jgi:hypothetical protein